MAAAVALSGCKRSYFDDVPPTPCKKLRTSSFNNSSERVEQSPNWIDLIIKEMTSAVSVDDARARASRVLEGFKKSTNERVCAETERVKCQMEEENMVLKKQKESLVQENDSLKRCVRKRQKEYESREQELKNVMDMVDSKREEFKKLEAENYGLKIRLNQALLSNYSTFAGGRFGPDVF